MVKQTYRFDEVNSHAECLQKHKSNMLIEKGEKVRVASTVSINYFFGASYHALISTKHGVGTFYGRINKNYFSIDGKIFSESNLVNPFLVALTFLMFFPFFLISPYLYYRYHSYLHRPNQTGVNFTKDKL